MTYSSSMVHARRGYGRRNQNAVSLIATTKSLGPISNTIILVVLACLIGLLYLTQVTKTNSYGYTINGLQKQQKDLQSQKTDLEISSARLKSLERVASSSVAKSLVSVAPSGTISQ